MLVTALNNHIGYDNASKIAKKAFKENLTLKEAALKLKLINEKQFNKIVQPKKMVWNKLYNIKVGFIRKKLLQ